MIDPLFPPTPPWYRQPAMPVRHPLWLLVANNSPNRYLGGDSCCLAALLAVPMMALRHPSREQVRAPINRFSTLVYAELWAPLSLVQPRPTQQIITATP